MESTQPAPQPLIVLNPAAGLGERNVSERRLRRALKAEGLPDDWIETTPDHDADRIIEEHPSEGPVVVIGGDGTIQAAARVLRGSDRPLTIVPVGTGNVMAARLGIPLALRPALRLARVGVVRSVDLGMSGDEPFLLAIGAGFDGRLIREADRQLKSWLGKSAYVLGAAKHLPIHHYDFHITVDGVEHLEHAASVIVANFGTQMGPWIFPPDASGEDGFLDVAILRARTFEQVVDLIGASLGLTPEPRTGLSLIRGRQIEVRCQQALPVQLDGDDQGDLDHFSARIRPGSLRVTVPDPETRVKGIPGWPPRVEWPPRLEWPAFGGDD